MEPNHSSISVRVAAEDEELRIDLYLAQHIADLSRSRIQQLLKEGCVMRQGEVVLDGNKRVRPGDEFTISLPALKPVELIPERMDLDVLYEDDDLLVVEKPAGTVVHPSAGHAEHTLVHALLAHCGSSLSGIGGVQRPGIVHRLDKDVSGLMVVAKNDKAHLGLAQQFTLHTIDRRYQAVVFGRPVKVSGRIEGAIGRHPKDRKKQALVSNGKHARTDWELIETNGFLTSVRCKLYTGRTHQIRVHLSSIGHHLVGDRTYKPRKKPKLPEMQEKMLDDLKRILLHAYLIGFDHPLSGEKMRFEKPPPAIFSTFMAVH